MSRIRADKFVDRAATGAPELTQGVNFGASGVGGTITAAGQAEFTGIVTALGANVTGVVTATTFIGALSGNATSATTATTATNASGLTGSPSITVTNINAADITASGTLTYEDVTNVDSVGVVTARSGLNVVGGGATVTGIATFHSGAHFDGGGLIKEKANVVAGRLSDVSGVHVNLEDGMTHVYTTDEDGGGAGLAVNIRFSSSVELMDRLSVGETISVNITTKPNGNGYIDEFTVDGAAVTEEWNGGAAPSSAAAGGFDLTTVQITRIASTGTENTDLLVQCNNSNFA